MQSTKIDERIMQEVSCLKCVHFPVCYIVRGLIPFVEQDYLTEKTKRMKPFEPTDVAKICRYYNPDFPAP